MKRIVCAVIVPFCVLSIIGGCGQGGESSDPGKGNPKLNTSISAPNTPAPMLLVDYPGGRARTVERIWDATSKRVLVSLDAEYQGLPTGRYKMEVQPCRWGSTERGARAALFDRSSALLYEYTFRWDESNPTWVSIVERTSTDQMTILRAVNGDSIHEAYEINGSSQNFDYSLRILDFWRGLIPTDSLNATELQLANQVSSNFQLFYQDNNSLHENRSGELLVYLMTNHDLHEWMAPLTAFRHKNELSKVAFNVSKEDICAIAGICDKLKCLPVLGGLANPLCVPCAGIDIACNIADVVSWISSWFDDD